MTGYLKSILVLAGILSATAAQAHDVNGLNAFQGGVVHPFIGIDHLLAMVAVGIWASGRPGRTALRAPFAFVAMLVAGSLLAAGGVTVPFVEPVILLSVMVVGLMIAAAGTVPVWLGTAVIGAFAFFHGAAHGSETMGASAGGLVGFVIASAALHIAGFFAGRAASGTRRGLAGVGFAIAAAGFVMAAG